MVEEQINRDTEPMSRPSITAAAHVNQNVETIAALQAKAEETVSHHQRLIERLTAFVGRPVAFYSIIILVSSWIAFNLAAMRWGTTRPLDPPPFFWLQGAVALSALLVATMVLTTQNRQAKHAEKRSQLDLQVNLLAEQKVTKLIALLEELRRDLPVVPDRDDPVAAAMTRAVDPHAVISALEGTFEGGPPAPDAGNDGLDGQAAAMDAGGHRAQS
jgi:uncharacterized membrane protein